MLCLWGALLATHSVWLIHSSIVYMLEISSWCVTITSHPWSDWPLLVKMASRDVGISKETFMAAVNLGSNTVMYQHQLIFTEHLLAPCYPGLFPSWQGLAAPLKKCLQSPRVPGCLCRLLSSQGHPEEEMQGPTSQSVICLLIPTPWCGATLALRWGYFSFICSNVPEGWSAPDIFFPGSFLGIFYSNNI